MKKCPNCGRAYSDMVSVCPACKTSLSGNAATNRPAPQQSSYQPPRPTPQPQQPTYQPPRPTPQPQQPAYQPPQPATTYYDDDKAGIVWLVLSFLLPIIGIILYFKWRYERPAAAKSVSIAACAGIFLGIALTSFSNFSSPKNKTPNLTEGHYSAYTAMFTDLGISEIPASFSTENTASYGRVIEGSIVETIRMGYEGDVVLSWENIQYIPTYNLTAQDIELMAASIQESMASISLYSHIDVTYMTGANAYAVVVRIDNMDQEAVLRDAAAAGVIQNSNVAYISIEESENGLLAQGYLKK